MHRNDELSNEICQSDADEYGVHDYAKVGLAVGARRHHQVQAERQREHVDQTANRTKNSARKNPGIRINCCFGYFKLQIFLQKFCKHAPLFLLFFYLIYRSAHPSVNQSNNQSINQSTNQSQDTSIRRPINDWSISWLIHVQINL